jgi:hypothetical protein
MIEEEEPHLEKSKRRDILDGPFNREGPERKHATEEHAVFPL